MNTDYNENLLFNDLSIDREAYKKQTRNIEGSSGWSVDNRGTVYNSRGKPVNCGIDWDDSPYTKVATPTGRIHRYINDIVLCSFIGPPPSDKHIPWHRDGDKSNSRLDNLSWVVLKKGRMT